MNQVQKAYALAKAKYEAAVEAKNWALVEELEDQYLDAEFALFDWVADVVTATGGISREDTDFLRRNSNGAQWEKMIKMGMRLQA